MTTLAKAKKQAILNARNSDGVDSRIYVLIDRDFDSGYVLASERDLQTFYHSTPDSDIVFCGLQ